MAAIEEAGQPDRHFRDEGGFIIHVVESFKADTVAFASVIAANNADPSSIFLAQVEPLKKAASKV